MAAAVVLSLASCLLSLVFAGLVLAQWRQRRHAFQLVWGLGLLFYGIAAGAEAAGSVAGWTPALYRAWYLFGAVCVAAYLGAGTIYLLARTRFGYFVAFAVLLGGAISLLAAANYPGAATAAAVTFGLSVVAALAIAAASAIRPGASAHVAMAFLVAGSLAVSVPVLTAGLASPGYAIDPRTHAPLPTAFPGYVRVLTLPFNIGGGLALLFGAIYSAYVYMPKVRLLRARVRLPVARQLYAAAAVLVNLVASLPRALAWLFQGRLSTRVPATLLIALGAFIPGLTSGLERFGVTWSFFLGQFLGVLLILLGFLVSEDVFRELRLFRRRPLAAGPGPGGRPELS